jgi:uncharacterized protein YndB with AHSA1/START domain
MTIVEHVVDTVRVIAATPEELYAAWTEPSLMRKWMARTVEADVRVGGRYRMEVDQPDGAVHVFTGEYLELDPPRQIVMTFRVEGPSIDEKIADEKVTVLIEPEGDDRTRVTIRNTWTGEEWGEDAYEALREGWGQWLDLLAKVYE